MNVRLKPTGGLKFDGKNIVPDYDAICALAIGAIGTDFQPPTSPNCIEPTNSGHTASLAYSNLHLDFL